MPKIKKICVVCGKPFEVYPSESGIQCCSRKCGTALRYQQFYLHFSRYVIL